MKISRKITLLFILVAALVGVIGVFSVSAIQRIVDFYGGSDQHFKNVLKASTEVITYGKSAEGHLVLFMAMNDVVNREMFFNRHASLLKQVEILEKEIENEKSRGLLNEIKQKADELLTVGNILLKAYDEDMARTGKFNLASYTDLIKSLNLICTIMRQKGTELSIFETELENQKKIDAEANALVLKRNIIITAVAALFLAVVFGLALSRSIAKPILHLKAATIEIGKGNLNAAAEIKSEDEIGDLARSFNQMVADLKKSRSNLTAAQNFTDTMLNSMVDFVVVINLDLTISQVNKAALKINGYEEHELIGKSVNMLIGDRPFTRKGVDSLRKNRFIANLDKINLNKDGTLTPISMSLSVFQDEHGEDLGIICVGKDITERKEAEQKLAFESSLMQALMDNIPDAIYFKDTASRFVRVSKHINLKGIGSPEEAIGKTDFDFFVEDLARLFYEDEQQIMRTGKPLIDKEEQKIFLDGSTGWVLTTKVPIFDAEGKVTGIIGASRDITERKMMEEELRSREMLLAESQRIARIGSFHFDISTKKVRWSAELWRIFGLEPQEWGLNYKEFLDRVHPDDHEFVKNTMEKFYREKKFPTFHHRIIRPDGMVRVINNSGKFVFDENKKAISIHGIHQDITEQNEMEQELRIARDAALESARLKSEFLANMSHEIRTPMNGVMGMTGLLLDTTLNPEQRDYAETIESSAEGLLRIIDDILDFSKIEAGQLYFEKIDFNLNEAVEGAVGILAERAMVKGIEIASLIYSDVPTLLKGDPGRLRQILTNLIGNAIKFTEKGEVTVTVRKHDEGKNIGLRFEIKDTGIGISEDAQRKLFRAFVQADGSTTRKYGGTGLGLAISKELAEMMGGKIGIESKLGEGSTFWFTAYFEAQADQTKSEQRINTADLEGVRTLIVDDNTTNRRIFVHQTASWGMIPTEAESGAEALEILRSAADRKETFEVAILDLMMPEMDGFQLAEAIKADPIISSTRLILLPSFGKRGHGKLARKTGIAAYLQKPVRQSQLYSCLVSVMCAESENFTNEESPRLVTKYSLNKITPPNTNIEKFVSTARILVAEDNPVNQKVAFSQLKSLGYAVEIVNNGREAVNALKKADYDIVLMDCQMPEMDGFEATAEIRRQEKGEKYTKIVAMTAHAIEGDREKCLSAGMDDYLSKPVKIEMLQQMLEKWVSPEPKKQNGIEPNSNTGSLKRTVLDSVEASVLESFRDLQKTGEPDFITEIIDLFLEDASSQIAFLAAADITETRIIKEKAHSLKGSSGNVGAHRMAAISVEIEENISDLGKVRLLINELICEFENVKSILSAMRKFN